MGKVKKQTDVTMMLKQQHELINKGIVFPKIIGLPSLQTHKQDHHEFRDCRSLLKWLFSLRVYK